MAAQFLLGTIAFLWGVCLGSFINVVSLRFSTGESSVRGRSRCPHCHKQLTWWELLPLVSFVALRGKCANCKQRLSLQYPLVEVASGVLAVSLLQDMAVSWAPLLTFAIALVLLTLFLIDLRTFILPDFYVVLLAVLAALLHAYGGSVSSTSILMGVLFGSGFLLFLWLVTWGRGIGLGDVKLAVPLGLMFGFSGIAVVLFMSFIVGGLTGLLLLAAKRATPKTAIPFGPFLTGSALVLLMRPGLVDTFRRLIGV